MQTQDVVEGLLNFQEFFQPSKCLDEVTVYVNREKVLYCFYNSLICANLKRHKSVYILSSKHTYTVSTNERARSG